MKLLLKSFLAGSVLLLFSLCASGQNFIEHAPATPPKPPDAVPNSQNNSSTAVIGHDFYRPLNSIYCRHNPACYAPPPDDSGPIYVTPVVPSTISNSAPTTSGMSELTPIALTAIVPSQIGAPSGTSPTISASGPDADSAPAIYMPYKEAVALGNEINRLNNDPSARPSLGEVARASRAKAESDAANSKHITVTQDSQGKILVCKSDSTKCP
jgi:hypothetical protein